MSAIDKTRIVTYRQDRPKDFLRENPQETWRCDIYAADGSTHHGVGAIEAKAVLNAATAFIKWSLKTG